MHALSPSRIVLVVCAVLASGCDPCRDLVDVELSDRDSLLADGELKLLRGARDDFFEWTGGDRVCLDGIEVAQLDGEPVEIQEGRLGARRLVVDPDNAELRWSLFWGLCLAMDQEEDLSGDAPGLFPADETRHGLFADSCAYGPRADVWAEQAIGACGYSDLSDRQVYVGQVAFPDGPQPRIDGPLYAAYGRDVRISEVEGDGWTVTALVQADDGVAMLRTADETPEIELLIADLEVGSRDTVLQLTTTGIDEVKLYGGSRPVLVVTDWLGLTTLFVVDPDSLGVKTQQIELDAPLAEGVVSGPWLYVVEDAYEQAPVYAVELATGDVRTISLPTPKLPLQSLPSGTPVAAPDGFAVAVLDAMVKVVRGESETIITASVYRTSLQRYDVTTDDWTELLSDTWAIPAGTTSDSLMVGALFGSGPNLLAAYDLNDDRLLISEDVCLDDFTYPRLVAGDRSWVFMHDNEFDLVGRPLDLWE